jgi:RNA polymerase sigma-70 factor (ECF subfamily)
VATEAAREQPIGTADSDLDLVYRLQRADSAAYAELCDRFGPRLHGFAASRLAGDGEIARDAMVQALVDAVRNIRRFNPRKATFSAWLYGIARRQIGLAQRRQRRKGSVPASAQISIHSLSDLPASENVADDLANRLDAKQQVALLAESLTALELEVLNLHCVEELSMKEIGRVIGRSEAGVESVLYRARQKARERLAAYAD